MDAAELQSMYRRWLSEVWGQGREDVAADLISGDLIDHNPLPGQPPGLDGHKWAVAMIRKAFPDLRFTADVIVSDDQFVTGRWTMTGTNTGTFDLFGLPPTDRPVTMTGQEIFRVEAGKFAEVWHQEDIPAMLSQLGLEPPPAIMRLAARRSARKYRRTRQRSA
jgi:predicted ester cyclase